MVPEVWFFFCTEYYSLAAEIATRLLRLFQFYWDKPFLYLGQKTGNLHLTFCRRKYKKIKVPRNVGPVKYFDNFKYFDENLDCWLYCQGENQIEISFKRQKISNGSYWRRNTGALLQIFFIWWLGCSIFTLFLNWA